MLGKWFTNLGNSLLQFHESDLIFQFSIAIYGDRQGLKEKSLIYKCYQLQCVCPILTSKTKVEEHSFYLLSQYSIQISTGKAKETILSEVYPENFKAL